MIGYVWGSCKVQSAKPLAEDDDISLTESGLEIKIFLL